LYEFLISLKHASYPSHLILLTITIMMMMMMMMMMMIGE
jgi:hypothetical protein